MPSRLIINLKYYCPELIDMWINETENTVQTQVHIYTGCIHIRINPLILDKS
jgi:hypothetical protein